MSMAPTTPLRTVRPHLERGRFSSLSSPTARFERPLSETTEFIDYEDDDSSVFEEDSETSGSSHCNSVDSRRQSQTTVSSYGVPTPRSSRGAPFEIMIKPVEGPKGPHLFRASQHSADFFLDGPLQLSPVLCRDQDQPPRAETALSQGTERTLVPQRYTQSPPPMQPEPQFPQSESPISADPLHWSIQQVVRYMHHSDVSHDVTAKLQQHDITGKVLMTIQFEDLKELEITSFGKRHELWNAIQALKGGETGPSPVPTPFQDTRRPCSNIRSKSDGDIPCSPCSGEPISPSTTPISCTAQKKKRHHRKHRRHREEIEPGESVSIVAIEQVIPKPHECSKGEACPTWRKRERLLRAIQKEQAMGGSSWPVSPTRGGHIMITGDPGNPSTAQRVLPNSRQDPNERRPASEVVPSVVASSDLLGPGQLPEFALHEDMLQQLEHRDPQENVKQFLTFQHVTTAHVEDPPSPPLEMFPAAHHEAFHNKPSDHVAYMHRPGSVPCIPKPDTISVQYRSSSAKPHQGLKKLSKLSIPRSASANPHLGGEFKPMSSIESAMSPGRTLTASPNKFRSPSKPSIRPSFSHRPGSELDVPVTAVPAGPISRDDSQSAPPQMQYREPSSVQRSNSRSVRRPSFAMPKLQEDQVFSTVSTVPPTTFPAIAHQHQFQRQNAQDKSASTAAEFGPDVAHAGWMKKRKTKLLRHDWQDAHCRLHGTVLDLHENSRLSAAVMDTIDVDEYTVAVSGLASNSKISSALKSLKISGNVGGDGGKHRDGGAHGGAAFAFQLVPGDSKDRAKFATGKTHHFAVKSSSERIDWMRELMLAKAKKQKESGFVVEHNGVKA